MQHAQWDPEEAALDTGRLALANLPEPDPVPFLIGPLRWEIAHQPEGPWWLEGCLLALMPHRGSVHCLLGRLLGKGAADQISFLLWFLEMGLWKVSCCGSSCVSSSGGGTATFLYDFPWGGVWLICLYFQLLWGSHAPIKLAGSLRGDVAFLCSWVIDGGVRVLESCIGRK